MGFFDSGTEESTSTQTMPAWQENAVKQNLSDAMSTGPIMFSDRNLTAGYNPALTGSYGGAAGLTRNGLTGSYLGSAARAGIDALGNPNAFRPEFDQRSFDSVMQNTNLSRDMAALDTGYNAKLAEGLRRAGYGAGGFSGNFGSTGALAKSGAVGAAAGDYTRSLAALYGGTRDRAIQAGIGYGAQGAQNGLTAANALVNNAYQGLGVQSGLYGQQFGMGQYMQGLDQAGIDREVNRDNFNAAAPQQNIAFRSGMAGRMGDYGGTTTTRTPTSSPFQQALGAGIGLAGAYLTGGGSLAMGGMGGMFGGGVDPYAGMAMGGYSGVG